MPLIRDFNDPNLVPMDNPIEARKNDLLRITEWLKSPAGLKFVAKQGLLRATAGNSSNNRADLAKNIGKGATDAASAIAVILAQIPVAGTGTHFLFNELSSLAFQDASFYSGNRFASMQANYRGTINITKKTLGRKSDANLDTYYNSDPNRVKGVDVYDGINGQVFNTVNDENVELYQDLVPFYFGIQGLKDGINQTIQFLQFRGFFEGNLSDTFNGNWNTVNYVGRGENFYTYQSFSRSITFSFKTAAFAEKEIEVLADKLNALASVTAPTYSDRGFMRGTLVKLTIGDYIRKMPGKIDSISISSDFNTPWEITPGLVLPMLSTVNVQFTPIHENVPQTVTTPGENTFIKNKTYYE